MAASHPVRLSPRARTALFFFSILCGLSILAGGTINFWYPGWQSAEWHLLHGDSVAFRGYRLRVPWGWFARRLPDGVVILRPLSPSEIEAVALKVAPVARPQWPAASGGWKLNAFGRHLTCAPVHGLYAFTPPTLCIGLPGVLVIGEAPVPVAPVLRGLLDSPRKHARNSGGDSRPWQTAGRLSE